MGAEGTMTTNTVERATRLGRVRGFERLGVENYRGLRYAEAERFRSSVQVAAPWEGVYDATRFKAMAMQPAIVPELYGPVPDAPYSEDCLYLDVYAPQAPSATPRPVIFFIHGGSFTGGSGHCYDGTALARGADAIVVCINYRLGVFAALDLDWLGTDRDGQGQLWLGDQINALRWVRDNIADYGGDPNLVTIIGESAGAVSVAALCSAPKAEGLVHRAVACSTGYMIPEASRDVIDTMAKLRRKSREETLAYLKDVSAEELIGWQKRGKQLSPTPVSGTTLLPGDMAELIQARGAKAVPLIAGFATHEGVSLELMVKAATGLPRLVISVIATFAAHGIAMHAAGGKANVKDYLRRLKKATGNIGFGSAFSDLVWTDGFRRGAVDYVAATTRAGGKGWVYTMDIPMRVAGQSIASSHGIDLALTFNVSDDPQHSVPRFADHPKAPELERRWVAMLGHFARHGEPGPALGDWPAHEAKNRSSMLVSCEGCSVQQDAERLYREQVWK